MTMLAPAIACANRMAHPEALEATPVTQSVTVDDRVRHPHRDPVVLGRAWVRERTITGVARRLDCGTATASLWLHVYGYRERQPAGEVSPAKALQQASDPEAALSEVVGDD
jgi:hypothetical protein